MHAGLVALAQRFDADWSGLQEAAALSQRKIDDARQGLLARLGPDLPLDVELYGSVARQEASTASDFDVLAIAFELLPAGTTSEQILARLEEVREGLDLQPPGSSGLFGRVVSAHDLVETVGLQDDTNFSHTRRILTLLEGVSVYRPEERERLVRSLLGRYLADHPEGKVGTPRFLLNDVLRYWRTIAVDYQAKLFRGRDEKWGTRYLKLIISRKLTIAGTVVSLFRCPADPLEFLIDELSKPPLARLAGLGNVIDEQHAVWPDLRRVFDIADEFRNEVTRVDSRLAPDQPAAFLHMRSRATDLQNSLETLFFDTPLRRDSRKYLSY